MASKPKPRRRRVVVDETAFLWRAIDLIVAELHNNQMISQWFRHEWCRLVEDLHGARED